VSAESGTHAGADAKRWISDVTNSQFVSFLVWLCAEFALSFAATLVIKHHALGLPVGATFSGHYLAAWAATWGASTLLLALLAGALVFRRSTPWDVVLVWPLLVGPVVGAAFYFALVDQMDQGSRMCGKQNSCDISWGFGAVVVSVAASIVLGAAFISTASLKRLVLRP